VEGQCALKKRVIERAAALSVGAIAVQRRLLRRQLACWNIARVPQHLMADKTVRSAPRSTASIAGHPLHVMLVPIPIVCFVATLVTDIVYWQTANMLWADMSAWLLVVGLIVSVFAIVAGLIDFLGDCRIRTLHAAWIHVVGNVTVIIISIFNAFIHSRDAYTSVVPTGLILSAIVVLILLVTGWNGWTMVYRHGVGVRQDERP
jgi:uncharacterized membrane protein